ncbi:hypothetical protein ZWY2020_036684 [Hordeum vulgare]|nr:hypothetical protein ZWY2020_036684 [Hordeum vulgare]
MDAVDSVVDPLREFAKDSVRLIKRCHKPDSKVHQVGFFVKFIFIPINNIIVGSG